MPRLFLPFLLTGLVVWLGGSQAWSQAVFRMDSLSQQGLVVDKAWKWHLGDKEEWARPEFDDSRWDTLNPTQLLVHLPRLPPQGIGWLRMRLSIAPALRGRLVGVTIDQAGATALFLNGKKVLESGKINLQQRVEVNSINQANALIALDDDSVQVLAVRYAFAKEQLLHAIPYSFYSLRLMPAEVAETTNIKLSFYIAVEFALFGVFLGLGLLQLLLYSTFTKQRTTRSIGLFLITQSAVHLINGCGSSETISRLLGITDSLLINDCVYTLFIVGIAVSSFYYLLGIYQYFSQPRQALFWGVASLTFATIPTALLLEDPYAHLAYFLLGVLVPFLAIFRVGLLAIKRKQPGAHLFSLAHGMTLLAFVGWTLNVFLPIGISFLAKNGLYLFSLCFLGVALAVSLLLARERVAITKLLRQQLLDLEVLAQKTITQEQEKQQLLTTQNERLEEQIQARTAELKASQAQLIQKEKLASLGELTAGIAHEIQNPLNFVNNFAEVSAELMDELKGELGKGDMEEADIIVDDLRLNLQKITHHGQRASSIVKAMLEHSRPTSKERQPTDLNALAKEYLLLAYQGQRGQDKTFECELLTDFDSTLGQVEVVSGEIGRVLLNLYNNAFYAVQAKAKITLIGYHPRVKVSSKRLVTQSDHPALELRVSDNGTGIPDTIMAKVFQPFFTTKPTGEGTGLGLSLSYDIITKGHGGALTVESQPGQGSTFTLTLPIT